MPPYELKAAEERLMEVKMMYAHKIVRTVCLSVVFLLSLLMVACTAQNIYGPHTVKHTIRVKPEEAHQWYEKGYSVNWSTDDYYILEREEIVIKKQE